MLGEGIHNHNHFFPNRRYQLRGPSRKYGIIGGFDRAARRPVESRLVGRPRVRAAPPRSNEEDPRLFISVAFPIGVDMVFTYAVPERLRAGVAPGVRVVCPFRNRRLTGFCVGFDDDPPTKGVKEVERVLPPGPLLDEHLLGLARWMSRRYLAPLGQVLQAMVPAAVRRGGRCERVWVVLVGEEAANQKQRRVLEVLKSRGGAAPLADLKRRAAVSESPIRTLARRGAVRIERRMGAGRPVTEWPESSVVEPTVAQKAAIREVTATLGRGHHAFLLHGVAGSGKTEVYIRAAQQAVSKGLGVIVLVPEIALTPQTAGRFMRLRKVVVLHSRMSAGDRTAAWDALRRGEARVVVGPRSAIFAPVAGVGLIVIDEEQETAYKQESVPRYDGRTAAAERAREAGAVLLTGTATPDAESWLHVRRGEWRLLSLPERVTPAPAPSVEIVDLIRERASAPDAALSGPLADALVETVSRGEQAILFINRRGYAPLALCTNCRYAFRCPSCDITLTYHADRKRLLCHYCGHEEPVRRVCPMCWRPGVRLVGAGTQRVAEEVERLLGEESVLRLDSDAITSRRRLESLLATFRKRRRSVLVGTQMIAKGLHFPEVTLVGVVWADGLFEMPDHRACERGLQLLLQVSGRAGRGARAGRVMIQTVRPDHHVIRAARTGDYTGFLEKELEQRRRFGYPPFVEMARVLVEARTEPLAKSEAEGLATRLREAATRHGGEVLGPAPAPLQRLRGRFRRHMLLKAPDDGSLLAILDEMRRRLLNRSGVTVDVDPVSML